ncbi:TPA: DUF1853 family protein [Burkholderia vietnamiensis]|uniref:DUF1853 family protein n=1 Tax=Burkholderia vietnamiensis TaxID=60552 RepID=UPI0007569C2C|nr:DUF1853 family protein [Burkholderia vietnamiensis]KVF07390.1 hypothetical protein WJ05_22925 [Burkholderia vietnamiensis]MCA8270191.1 DUF1853 family protein [Burkholderia vietnamiensis]UKV74728.1 DUF1853 family protein [Burkholderia vietnamiensis]HDR8928909.1 DUF1853 family protein [Burkholderia vietnamiensis]HDR9019725.1 DUF1853 family protein [Burkholderia vietnamiensis]
MTHDAAFAFVDTLRDAAVRDLGWLLASPSLLTAAPGAPLAHPWSDAIERVAVEAWLAALDAAPQPLHRALDGVRPVRLGRYAECLLEYFLTHGPSLRLVAANLPLRSNGKTLGEVDFLVDAPDGRRLHWELAVKCYLCAPVAGAASLADFVGPNLADRLDRKRSRLLEHQLRLGDRHGFALLGYGAPSDAQMFVKGWLFYPYGVPLPPVSAEIADDHPRGFWLTHAQWPAWAAAQPDGAAWSVLPRLAWLAPRRLAPDAAPEALADTSGVPSALTARQAPALIGVYRQRSDRLWRETARGFIVPDDWPARAVAFAAPDR